MSRSSEPPVKSYEVWYGVKSGVKKKKTLNTEVTCLLSVWLASFRWHDLYVGLCMELGNLHIDVKGNIQSKQSRDRIPMLYVEAD